MLTNKGVLKPDKTTYKVCSVSGVARVLCALGQEIFLRPPSKKTTYGLKLKIGAKAAKEAKQNIYCRYFALF